MSKYIPNFQNERVNQIMRRFHGVKTGAYVRVQVGKRVGTVLKSRAEKEGFTVISEEAYQDFIKNGPPKTPASDSLAANPPSSDEAPKNE